MKKRNLKSLTINKSSISNLQVTLFGGNLSISLVDAPPGCMSQAGCTGGPDETMTCPLWSCYYCTGDK